MYMELLQRITKVCPQSWFSRKRWATMATLSSKIEHNEYYFYISTTHVVHAHKFIYYIMLQEQSETESN